MHANFRMMKQIPAIHEHENSSLKKVKVGRPQEKQRTDAFLEVARFLEENDDEQITIQDLIQDMEENLTNTEHNAYSYPHKQQNLKEHFGNKIIQTEINGKPNVVTFRNKVWEVLYDIYSQRDLDPEKDKHGIIETAARLIKDDIKAVKTSHCNYPSIDELGSEESIKFLPTSLRVVLTDIVRVKRCTGQNFFYWTGYNAGSLAKSCIGTTSDWFGCATPSPLYFTVFD